MIAASAPKPWPIPAPAQVLAENSVCCGSVQSSSALAHAETLIRQGKYASAAQTLENSELGASEHLLDAAFYLRVQIEIETGNHAGAKQSLVSRLEGRPGDETAVSLLQACIDSEFETGNRTANYNGPEDGEAAESDLSEYREIAESRQILALASWNRMQRRSGSSSRKTGLASLAARLPATLPGLLANACRALGAGEVRKICLCFEDLCVTSLHAEGESLAVVSEDLGESLLAVADAERVFFERLARRDGSEHASLPNAIPFPNPGAEYAPNPWKAASGA